MRPLAVYIHIPFCIRKCNYCDFLSAPAAECVRESYVEVLRQEIKSRAAAAGDYEVTSIFFGGGTPSLLSVHQLEGIMGTLREVFCLSPEAEITIECNPGTTSVEFLAACVRLGINRLSIGLQSANDEELKLLGRIHTFEQFLAGYQTARAAGFDNINIDIMAALPGQTAKSYEHTLNQVLSLAPEHISAYSLIIEEGTPFYEKYREGGSEQGRLPGEELEREMYERTRSLLAQAGYRRYEISNYAKPGRECRHNICYWERGEYLGFGIGAASLFQNCRLLVERDLETYAAAVREGRDVIVERQELTKKDCMAEFMFLGLRMSRGISKKQFAQEFSQEIEEVYGAVLEKYKSFGLLAQTGDRIFLTEHGIDVSNVIFSEFLLD